MRSRRACDACRQRKIQCDGDASNPTSQCNWCSCHGLACTFRGVKATAAKSKIRPDSKDDVISQSERDKNAVSDGVRRRQNIQPVFSKADTSISYHPNGANWTFPPGSTSVYLGLLLGRNRCQDGIPFFTKEEEDWINARTGGNADFQKLATFSTRQGVRLLNPPHTPIKREINLSLLLPSQGIAKAFLDAFYQSTIRLAFPVIDYTMFQETITVAHEDTDMLSSPKQTPAKACVLAFISMVGGLFYDKLSFLPLLDWDMCYDAARFFLQQNLDDANVENLQSALMLYLRQRCFGSSGLGSVYLSIACRMAFALGGHIYTKTQPFSDDVTCQERQTRHIRRLFWQCYVFDKDITLRTVQSPLICDKNCDLTLPVGYMETQFVPPLPDHSFSSFYFANESLVPFLPGELRLSMLKHKTYEQLYSAQAVARSDSEVIRAILELDDELESWRLSIPEVVRPNLSASNPKQPLSDLPLQHRMQNIILHLEYHHLVLAIHRAGVRCITTSPNTNTCGDETYTAINSSIALCLEASRSTLSYLRAVSHDLVGELCWVTVFYPVAAAMMLFLHILADPLALQSKADAELLSTAVDLIRSMPIRNLVPQDVGHTKKVEEFITELIRLGKCATLSAGRDMGTGGFGMMNCV